VDAVDFVDAVDRGVLSVAGGALDGALVRTTGGL
jgi:hypothetical protein